jgi:MFS family permease
MTFKEKFLEKIGLGELNEIDPRATTGLGLLILIAVFLYADGSILFPNYTLVMDEFGIDKFRMGLVSSIFIIIGAAATIFWGVIADRASRKKMLVFGVLAGEIPCLLTAFAQSYEQLLLIRAFTGVGIGVMIPISNSLIGDYFSPKRRGAALSWFGVAVAFGGLLGIFFAGNLGEIFHWTDSQRWRIPFILAAAPNLLLAPLFYFLAYEPERGLGEPELREVLKVKSLATRISVLERVKNIFSSKTNLITFAQGVFGCVPWGVLPAWLITYLAENKKFSISSATIVYMLLGLGLMCGTLYGGYVGDWAFSRNKMGKIWVAGIFILLGVPVTFLILLAPLSGDSGIGSLIVIGAISALAGSVLSVGGINISSMLMDVNPPESRGTLFSVFNLTDSLGRGVGPALGGLLADRFGLFSTMNAATLFWIPCGLLVLALLRYAPREMERLRSDMRERADALE